MAVFRLKKGKEDRKRLRGRLRLLLEKGEEDEFFLRIRCFKALEIGLK